MHRSLGSSLMALVFLTGLACASASVDSVQRYGTDRRLSRPPVFLVYDFAVSPSEALVDVYGSSYAASSQGSSKEETKARKLAASLSRQTVDKLNKKGVKARWAADTETPPLKAIVLRGHFLTIDEGSRVARMVIGFGAGATEVRVAVQAYQAEDWGLRRLVQAEVGAQGSKMPGMAVPVGAGAIAGNAARSAAISGGANVVQEVAGGLEPDAGRMAEQIAKRVEGFYKRQGWL
ncbi:MAG: DUF4410 domain-containing protein [Deltaproteobacteria bacterium]|nr:DUF4410 domain-containing protein [Deltaproteobacteria bacterium]